jgi:HK97 family phage portal protein
MPNFFNRWWERRSLAAPSPSLLQLFSSAPTAAGVSVTPASALSVPCVFACTQVLSQDVARTPIRFKEKVGDDTYIDAVDHPLHEILGSLPNPETTSFEFQFAMMWQLLCHGCAFAEIVRSDNRVEALWPLASEWMRVDRTPAGVKRWTYMNGGRPYSWLFDPSMPPILEVRMETPMLRCREAIGAALALQAYVAKFFANDARPGGILTATGAIGDESAQRMQERWKGIFGGAGTNRRGIAVIDSDIKFQSIATDNDSAQLNETQRVIGEQIAGAFRVPASKIGDLSKANYSNMEVSEQVYINSTLDPYFRSFELAFRRDLLTSRQFSRYAATFDRAALTKNDTAALHASLAQGLQAGFYSQNDCRRKLGENPIPDGDTYYLNAALQPLGTPPKEAPSVA